jgi:hypothetical protein
MPERYSNFTRPPQYLVQTSARPVARPYVASNYTNQLTYKERLARQQARSASDGMGQLGGYGVGAGLGGSGIGLGGGLGGGTVLSSQGNFFSPQLSTDFLELPQSIRERREIYRHFYNSDELVGQAIDLHTELPLSKVRLAAPKPRTAPKGFKSPEDYGKYILSRFERMCKKVKLFQRLITMVHHYWLDGLAAIFAEDSVVEVPPEVGHTLKRIKTAILTDDGQPIEKEDTAWVEDEDREHKDLEYYRKNYLGWEKLIVLPIDKVQITTFNYTDRSIVELIPSDRDKALIEKARLGDPVAEQLVQEIPVEVREHIGQGRLIPLGTDPDEGSFVYVLTGSKSADSVLGQSILNRCLRTLYYREKLRQAQTSIASRAMTPRRIVWAEGLSDTDVDQLREQVDLSLVDPDYSIVTNYEVHWEEMSSRDRLLDLSAEYEQTERRLLAGLGVTESLMTGESLYSGDRLKLEVINQRYLHLREILQEYVHESLFRPVAERMGFVEEDEWGQKVVLFPQLSFTRLPLRDSQDTFDALYNLYSKGSISIDLILEMLNIDPNDTKVKIERDMFTVNDAIFNEILRSLYNEVGRLLVDKTDVLDRIAKYMDLKIKEPPKEEDSRF